MLSRLNNSCIKAKSTMIVMSKIKLFLSIAILLFTLNTNASIGTKPNIVFFLVDDMGWKDLGTYGAKLYETPNIDKLCSEGIKFTNAYTSAPICSPTRASVLSGIHPLKLGMWHAPHFIKPADAQNLLPKLLKENDYTTWHIGKWHMGTPKENTMPTDIGFDVNIGGDISWGPGSYFWPYNSDEKENSMGHPRDHVPLRKGGHEGEQLTDRLTREAIHLIDNHDTDQPFYLNFWYYSVHNRKEAKPELIEKYKKKIQRLNIQQKYRVHQYTGDSIVASETNPTYAAMLETVDNSVGDVVRILKEKGLYENTLFVFYSDNGPTTNDVPCTPLMGGKNTTYEAGVRMPAFFTWNGHIDSGQVSADRIIIMDVFNTVLEAASGEIPEDYSVDGVSLISHFNGKSLPKREFFWYFPVDRPMYAGRSSAAMMDKNGWKFIHFFKGDPPELYNINNDISESDNLYDLYPMKAKKMGKRLAKFLSESGYPEMSEMTGKN